MAIRVLRLGKNEVDAVTEIIESGLLASTLGSKTAKFEEAMAEYLNVKKEGVIAVNSGTAALHTLLLAYGIGPGDEVIVPAWTFISTASAVLMCGATPIFADIGRKTFNLISYDVVDKISNNTKAIIAVHIAGIPCDMTALKRVARQFNLLLFEDACQALGAEWKDEKVGTLADGGVYSFYPSKIITTGEGGMIVTNKEKAADICRMIRNHGQTEKFHATMLGYNYRMTELQAALGIVGLKKMQQYIDYQRQSYYDIVGQLQQMGLRAPIVSLHAKIAPTYLPLWTKKPIKEHEWYIPLYKLPLFKYGNTKPLENCEYAYTFGLRLPL